MGAYGPTVVTNNDGDRFLFIMQRKRKFAGSFARLDSIMCELVAVISD